MVAGHNGQSGSLQEMAGRKGQSEGAHEEDQAQSIQGQVPIRQKASSMEIITENYLAVNIVTNVVTNHVRVWPLQTRASIRVEVGIFTEGSNKMTLGLKCRPSRWRISSPPRSIKGTMPS